MAADSGTGSSGDWTAGIVAIVAALLLGSAIPIGLYFGLYRPKVAERIAAQENKTKLDGEMNAMIARQEFVVKLETEADSVAERIEEIEKPFALADVEKMDVPEVHEALLRLAKLHNLGLLPERQQQLRAEIVFPAGQRIEFPHGLMATKLTIETHAYFHDFGRFLTAMETMEKFVIIPESLICTGDSNGGSRHMFRMNVFVIERRDVDAIGR
ncbi:MAG: hypothetical protein R3E76_09210 [Planctomycetota bacterium]